MISYTKGAYFVERRTESLIREKLLLAPKEAFFCTCEDAYLLPSIIALESVRRFFPDAGFFIAGTFKEPNAMALLEHFSIEYLPLSETAFFKETFLIADHQPMWPKECFWHLAAYRPLLERGYSRSCCLDGDVLCVNPFDWEAALPSAQPLSVVHKRNGRLNSGVLFYHHEALVDMNFIELVKTFYLTRKDCLHAECTGFCLEKGDQDLLEAVLKHHRIDYQVLPTAYNFLLHHPYEKCCSVNATMPALLSDCFFLHIMYKPWISPPTGQPLYPLLDRARTLWADVARPILERAKAVSGIR